MSPVTFVRLVKRPVAWNETTRLPFRVMRLVALKRPFRTRKPALVALRRRSPQYLIVPRSPLLEMRIETECFLVPSKGLLFPV